MLTKLFRRLTGQPDGPAPAAEAATEDYNGYTIRAMPRKDADGWRVAGRIERDIEGSLRSHDFIRADAFPDHNDAVTVTLRKARQMIDQLGDRVFSD